MKTTVDIDTLARKSILQLKGYTSARDDFRNPKAVLLDANESPFNNAFNRYPDPRQTDLKQKIANMKGLREDQIFLGNGSDEVIDLLMRVFCEPGKDSILTIKPTYGMYEVLASVNNIAVSSVSLTPEFAIDLNAIRMSIEGNTKLIFLCSPNNPTGNLLDANAIRSILNEFSGIVVIDEAYIDFARQPSWSTQLTEYPNLVIIQTFSKAWGLAGLRLGMCLAHEAIIGLLNKIKAPYNINSYTQSQVLQLLQEGQADIESNMLGILAERAWLARQLLRCSSVIEVFPSDANFLLVRFNHATPIYKKLLNLGIVVRNRSSEWLCTNCLRITVGTSEENQLLIKAIQQ